MSNKLWVTRICVALSVLCLFIASSYAYLLWQDRFRFVERRLCERFWLSALLLVIAGVLLGISPEVFFNPRDIGFRPVQFIVSAIIPIFVMIFSTLAFLDIHWYRLVITLPDYIRSYIFSAFGHIASYIWLGVAIGKAIHVRRGQEIARTTVILP